MGVVWPNLLSAIAYLSHKSYVNILEIILGVIACQKKK